MTLRQVTYTSPSTWVWPGRITTVEVILVGGGGGAAQWPTPTSTGISGGGGGGVRVATVPVSGPVPITVGAGGTSGPVPTHTSGGTSSFGSISVGGGGRAGSPAPPIGGGGGGGTPTSPGVQTPGIYGHYGSVSLLNGTYTTTGAGGATIESPRYSGSINHFGTSVSPFSTTWGTASRQYGASGYYTPGLQTPFSAVPGCVIVKWFE